MVVAVSAEPDARYCTPEVAMFAIPKGFATAVPVAPVVRTRMVNSSQKGLAALVAEVVKTAACVTDVPWIKGVNVNVWLAVLVVAIEPFRVTRNAEPAISVPAGTV